MSRRATSQPRAVGSKGATETPARVVARRGRRRRAPQLGRIRTSLKRAHNLLNLILPEFNAWRDRIFDVERRHFEREDWLEAEAAVLDGGGE